MVAPPWFDRSPARVRRHRGNPGRSGRGTVDRGHDVTLIGVVKIAPGPVDPDDARRVGDRLGEALPEVVHAARAARSLDQLDLDLVHDHSLAGPLVAARPGRADRVTVHGPIDGEIGRYYRDLGPRSRWWRSPFAASDRPGPELGRHRAQRARRVVLPVPRGQGRLRALPRPVPRTRACTWPSTRPARPVAGSCSRRSSTSRRSGSTSTPRSPSARPGRRALGEADATLKRELLPAGCLVFPIQWEEPFGLVMVEAMACGTPVVALRRGSVPEVVIDG